MRPRPANDLNTMNILIIGATSAIAKATARLYVKQSNVNFVLVARNPAGLQELAADLTARGAASVSTLEKDFSENQGYETVVNHATEQLGSLDLVLMAHSILGDQQQCEASVAAMQEMMQVNAISSMSLLTLLANQMESQGKGTIAFISSVAGDRGRPSNYVYGSSKAVVTTFLQGLRARLAKSGVHVVTIKPGFVDTPMTAEIEKGGPLWAQPDDIAKGIARAVEKKSNVVYLPWFWRGIMAIIIHIPEFVFKKLSL